MPKPNSLTTKLRQTLARRIEPWPDPNEAWCMNCKLNGGRTLVLPATGLSQHNAKHRGQGHEITIKTRIPPEMLLCIRYSSSWQNPGTLRCMGRSASPAGRSARRSCARTPLCSGITSRRKTTGTYGGAEAAGQLPLFPVPLIPFRSLRRSPKEIAGSLICMKARELYMRCVKARIMSWLHSAQIGAVIHGIDGSSTVIAVYSNGKYVEPEVIRMPNSPGEMWGPDGPVNMQNGSPPQQTPPEEGGEQEGNDDAPDGG